MRFWQAKPWWPGETVFILGGGPSLKGLDLSGLAGRKVITVNNAFRLVPSPDIIFYADTRWWAWNKHDIPLDFPNRIVSTCSAGVRYLDPRVVRMGRDYRFTEENGTALSDDGCYLSGPDSGYMAINLAYLYGAARIVLLGFDMGFTEGEAHWHEDHPIVTPESNYIDLFAPKYPALVATLNKRGVEIVRCTPSRLHCIPEISLDEALALPNRQRA